MKFYTVCLLLLLALFVADTCARKAGSRRQPVKRDLEAVKSRSSDSDDDSHDSFSKMKKWYKYGKLTEARDKRAEIQRKQVIKLYTNVIWPASGYIGAEIEKYNYSVVADYLLENVTGRVNPLGKFDTFFLTGEYFYSLAGPFPGTSTTGRTRVTSLDWTVPIICANNTCRYRVNVEFQPFATNVTSNIFTHIGVANFDHTNRICSYEANFVGMERQLNLPESQTVRNTSIIRLCQGIQASCTGTNQQYASQAECEAFMHSVPYGGWGLSDQNTWQCRNVHLLLVRGNPALHCPHTGPTGGGRCIANSEATYLADDLDGCRDRNW